MLSNKDMLEYSRRHNPNGAHTSPSHHHGGKIHFPSPPRMIAIPSMPSSHQQPSFQHQGQSWGPWDCPLGRCNQIRTHIGNMRFRCLIEMYRPKYLEASRKSDKSRIAMQVFEIVQSHGGRFLDQSPETGDWVEIPTEKSLAKVSQALRKGTKPLLMSEKEQLRDVLQNHAPSSPSRQSPTAAQAQLNVQQGPMHANFLNQHHTTDGQQLLQQQLGQQQHAGISFLAPVTFGAITAHTSTSDTEEANVNSSMGIPFQQKSRKPTLPSPYHQHDTGSQQSHHRVLQHQPQHEQQHYQHIAPPSSSLLDPSFVHGDGTSQMNMHQPTQPSSAVLDSIQQELSQISGVLDTLEASSSPSPAPDATATTTGGALKKDYEEI